MKSLTTTAPSVFAETISALTGAVSSTVDLAAAITVASANTLNLTAKVTVGSVHLANAGMEAAIEVLPNSKEEYAKIASDTANTAIDLLTCAGNQINKP